MGKSIIEECKKAKEARRWLTGSLFVQPDWQEQCMWAVSGHVEISWDPCKARRAEEE